MKYLILITFFFASQSSFAYIFGEDNRDYFNLRENGLTGIGKYGDHCSAVAISKRYILTAAHCVYGADMQFNIGTFQAARNGFKRSSLAQIAPARIYFSSRYFKEGYTHDLDVQYDFALIYLEQDLPENVIPLKFASETLLPQDIINVFGYPGDRTHLLRSFVFKSSCEVYVIERRFLYHYCDVMPGQSGGPTIRMENGYKRLVAINVSQIAESIAQARLHNRSTPRPTHNLSLIIDEEIISTISKWMQDDRSGSEVWCKRGYCL